MRQFKALDLFSGAGGATRGLQQAGFHVTGVDIKPQPRYVGDAFFQADALTFPLKGFDFIHASPPCQAYSLTHHLSGRQKDYPQLIAPIEQKLLAWGGPWCLENVVTAPLQNAFTLCGLMFGLRVFRHRLFASSFLILAPSHPPHREVISRKRAGYYTSEPGRMVTVAGHLFSLSAGKAAMGIDWMTKAELAQAVPPAYAEFIGKQALAYLRQRVAA